MDIGAALREARQRRGLTLSQVASTTKLAVEILEKIERNQFESLPGGLFRRGYLRAFAAEVGVDREAVVAAYRTQYEPAQEEPEPPRGRTVSPDQLRLLASAATVLVLVFGLAFGALWTSRSPEDEEPAGSERQARSSAPVLPTSNDVQVVDTTARPVEREPAEGVFALRFHAMFDEACWISGVVDGERVAYGTLQPGTPLVVEAAQEIVLRFGNAGAVSYSINGYPGKPLGLPGQVVDVRITEDSYRDFVQIPLRTEA